MLLLIDVGNTRLKWALVPRAALQAGSAPGTGWIDSGAVRKEDIAGIGAAWARHAVSAVLVANVAGVAVAEQVRHEIALLPAAAGSAPPVRWFVAEEEVAGVRNGYREPHRLGCDRLAALVGARALMPGRDLIVATCGTATTVDALAADGRFIGGLILPGLGTMAASLARGTAQLPSLADLAAARADPISTPLFADHTEAAIRSGCLAAQAGAIERAVAAHGKAFCLLSGGAADWIAPILQVPHAIRENLVLLGLEAVATAQPQRFSGDARVPDTAGASPQPEAH